jgi:transcriptional regulator CtsR
MKNLIAGINKKDKFTDTSGHRIKTMTGVFVLVLLSLLPAWTVEQTWRYAVEVSAEALTSPTRIRLSWPSDSATGYTIYRKTKDAIDWGGVYASLSGTATSWEDSGVSIGSAYEYKIVKAATGFSGYGYIFAGHQAPPTLDSRGKIILVVDNLYAASLATELDRLKQDLVGDGWTVIRRDVARTDTPASVKSNIVSDYNADPANVKALFLFGHVPIFRCGNLNVDGHQARPLPSDAYYGDVNFTWGNPDYIPSDIELQVGRVDLWDLGCIQPDPSSPGCNTVPPCDNTSPGFSTPAELDLLRNYLNKDHNFRHKKGAFANVPRRALIGDRFGIRTGEAFAASGYRNFAPFFGWTNVLDANTDDNAPAAERWISLLDAGVYLWTYGCGGGDWDKISGLGLQGQYFDVWSSDIRGQDAQAVFSMLFGSWFVEWDRRGPSGWQCYKGNPMRTMLATPTYGLTSAWSGRPHHYYHHMGLGETIGYGIRLSQNNDGVLYQNQVNPSTRGIHIALMGDPTLRLHPVAPPSNLTAFESSGVQLSWTASPDANSGYHVYRASNPSGPFTRLTSSAVTGTTYTDASGSAGNTYMVRALKLENATGSNGSGSYYNPSQGIFATVQGNPAPSNLSATLFSCTQINLNWTDNGSNETGFTIERKTGAGGTYAPIATVGANVTTYNNTGLAANTTYFYRVQANYASGNSAWSNEASATTGTPTAPSTLTATAISCSQINVCWTDNANNETGFKIERKTGAGGTYAQIATVGANVTCYNNNTGLASNTTYYYRVRANNGCGDSAFSNEAFATTPTCVTTNITAQQPSVAMTINGSLTEASWSVTTPVSKLVIGTANNNTVTLGVLWDCTYLYVGAKVIDGNLFNDSTDTWHDDSVEIYIDGNHNKGTSYDAFDRQIVKGYSDGTIWVNGNQTAGILHGWAAITGGYSVEVAIPWSNLGISPTPGAIIGLDVGSNDDDNGSLRESQVMWSGTANNWTDTSPWGNVTLSGTNCPTPPLCDANTIAQYTFDGNYNDSCSGAYHLAPSGNVTLVNNPGWGQAARFANLGDQLSITIPDSVVMPGPSQTPLTIEARFYVRAYKAYSVGHGAIIQLHQDWDAKFELMDPMWPQSGQPIGYPQVNGREWDVIVTATQWRDSVSFNAWHKFKLTFAADGMARCYIDDVQIGSLQTSVNVARTTPSWTVKLGNFDGDIDEVRISNIVR